MTNTLETTLKLIDSMTDTATRVAASLGNVNIAAKKVSLSFGQTDHSLQGVVNKVVGINQLSTALSGVYSAMTSHSDALKSDTLEQVFNHVNRVTSTLLSMKEAYDALKDSYLLLQPLYEKTLQFFSLHNIALGINRVRTFLCAGAQAAATIVTKLWNKATDHAIINALTRLPLGLTATTIRMSLYMAVAVPATLITWGFVYSLKAVTKAIYSIPVVGWILAIISAVIAFTIWIVKGFQLLWDKSVTFREVLFGIWEVIKTLFSGLWEFIVSIGTGIAEFFVGIWQGITSFLNSAWQGICGFFTGIWNGLVSAFLPIKNWVMNHIIQPLKDGFSGLWVFISGMIDKVMNKLDGMLAPIRALWNKLFGKTNEAWNRGKAKGRASFEADHPDKKEKQKPKDGKPKETGLQVKEDNTPATPSFGNGGNVVNERIGSMGNDSGRVSNTYITLGSLVETLTIQSANLTEGVNDMREMVVRTLLEVLNGQNVAGARY